jgi:hypothetical protein
MCKRGHEVLSEGEHQPRECAWPGCPEGVNGNWATTKWTDFAPTEPIQWGMRPEEFTQNKAHEQRWYRQQGWRPNGHEVWRWVEAG